MKSASRLPIGISVLATAVAVALLISTFNQTVPLEIPETEVVEVAHTGTHTSRLPTYIPRQPVRTGLVPATLPPKKPTPVERELAQETPLALLPANTLVAGVVPDYLALVNKFGALALLNRHGAAIAEAEAELADAGLVFRDLLDPSSLGIDASAAMVFAVIGVEKPVIIFGARIADEDKLQQTIDHLSAEGQLETEPLDTALLTTTAGTKSPRFGILRRAGLVYGLVGDGWPADISTVAAQLAWQAPEDSLITTHSWTQAFDQVKGSDGWLYVSGPAMFAEAEADIRSDIDTRRARMDADRLAALKDGTTPTDPETDWRTQHIRRLEGTLSMAQAFFGGLGGIGIGFEMTGGALTANGHIGMEPGSLLQRLLRNRHASSGLMRALDRAPMYAIDGAMDSDTLVEMVELLASAVGADLAQALQLVKAFGAMDQEPLSLLDGAFGLALMQDTDDDGDTSLQLVMTVGVTNHEVAQRLITNLGGLATMAGAVAYDEETDGINFDIPGWRKVHLALVDGTVILTTQMESIDRLKRRAAPIYELTTSQGADQLLSRTGQAGMTMFDFGQVLAAMNPAIGEHKSASVVFSEDADVSDKQTAALEELQNEQEALYAKHRVEERERTMALHGILGQGVMVGTTSMTGMRFDAGWFTGVTSPEDLLAAIVDFAVAQEQAQKDKWQAIEDVQNRRKATAHPGKT